MAETLALIDLGSNAVRFLLARIDPGIRYRVLHVSRVQTRLAASPAGRLSAAALRRTLDSTRRFLRRVHDDAAPKVVAIATAAVRDAANRDHLIDAFRKNEGVELRVLSGHEEAHLGALAAIHTLAVRRATVADLGGGSLQLARVRSGQVVQTASLTLGTVRTTTRFLHDDPPTARQIRALREEIREQVLGHLPAGGRVDDLVGVGGTARALARLHLATRGGDGRRHGLRLTRAQVSALREELERRTVRERRRLEGLDPKRADIILAGAITIEELMTFGDYPVLTVCSARVHDCLLWQETFRERTRP